MGRTVGRGCVGLDEERGSFFFFFFKLSKLERKRIRLYIIRKVSRIV